MATKKTTTTGPRTIKTPGRGRPKKRTTIKGEYKPLIKDVKELNQKLIDQICKTIETEQLFLKTSCIVNGVDFKCLTTLLHKAQKDSSLDNLRLYAVDAIEQAENKAEQILFKEWRDKGETPYNKVAAKEFLEKINPKFNAKDRQEKDDNYKVILEAAKSFMDDESYLSFLLFIADIDPQTKLEELDQERIRRK